MAQEVIEVTQREVEIIEVIERGPVGPTGPQPDINYTVVSSARTLEAADLIAADTSGGAFTLTLPANPSNGDAVDIFDFSETFDTNPLTIARNGSKIESLEENLVCNVEGAYFTLIYTGSTRGWQVLPRYGTSGGGGESALTTQGDMLYRGVGINTRLPIGSAGQILKVNSGATAPEWGAAPATGVTSVGVSGSDGIEVDSGSPITGSGTIALGVNAASLRSHINVADGANNYTHPNHSGEVTSSGDGATTIANDVVTNAKLANVATATIKGRATAGTGDPEDLSASQVRTILNVADGAEANVNADWNASSGDAQILNKPSTFTPTAHAASHASSGSDPLAPSSIGAQSLFSSGVITGASSPAAARAIIYDVMNFGSAYDITLPITNSLQGDIFVFRATNLMAANVTIKFLPTTGGSQAVGTLTAVGEQLRFTYRSSAQEWILVEVDSHPANRITSGTLTHERGGLEADVSAYNGLLKISGGATSAVTVTSAGEALLDDADAAAQRTTLGLGTAATAATGDFAAASHSHGNINSSGQIGSTAGLPVVTTTAGAVTTLALGTANQVLRVNSGATGVEFADPAASGVTGAAASASDVLGVSGANITGVDATADRIVFWDDSASALKYLEAGSGLTISGTVMTASGGASINQAIAVGFVLN